MAETRIKDTIFFFHGDSPFSNWQRRGFVVKGIYFHHMEGFIMYCKAKLFEDEATAAQILQAPEPMAAKKLGRQVSPFNKFLWEAKCEGYAVQGNIAKFEQCPADYAQLMATGTCELVEASPYDSLWGIGIGIDDPCIMERWRWGKNRQGQVLMRTRAYFETHPVLFP